VNRLPLFGQDSTPQNTSSILSLIITCFLWIIMSVAGIFVKFDKPKNQYETVQIVLDSPKQVLEETEKSEAAVEAESEVESIVEDFSQNINQGELIEEIEAQPIEEVPVIEEKTEVIQAPKPVENKVIEEKPVESKPKPVETKPVENKPKPVETKTQETPSAKEPEKVQYELQKSAEELWEEQMSKKKQSQEVDWDALFSDSADSTSTSSSSSQNKVNASSSITGSAAKVSDSENKAQTTGNKEQTNQSKKASDTTSDALKDISNASASGKNTKAEISANTSKDGSGKLMMEMSDGSKRALLIPSEPAISLSEKAAQMISVAKATVRITFKVVEKGNIPRTEIKITPEAILPELVRTEIIDQLSKWVFEAADKDASASFEYTIEKR